VLWEIEHVTDLNNGTVFTTVISEDYT